jgi:hypothetical protein
VMAGFPVDGFAGSFACKMGKGSGALLSGAIVSGAILESWCTRRGEIPGRDIRVCISTERRVHTLDIYFNPFQYRM